MSIRYAWRGYFTNKAVNALHAEAFEHQPFDDDWEKQLDRHSLGWVCAYAGDKLVGFVNLAWDGGVHGFLLDTIVARSHRRQGIGSRLVSLAVDEARRAGLEWLHVDYDSEHRSFYLEACGFTFAEAGLFKL
jgi:ribosomal protein S18 acetylase RimI-like enzyme